MEEAECQRAYDLATEVYMSTFDRTKPPEEVSSCLFSSYFYFQLVVVLYCFLTSEGF